MNIPIRIRITIGALAMILLALFSAKIYAQKKYRVTCAMFQTQEEAQNLFESDKVKYKSLDGDNDGIVCEKLKK